MTIATSCGLTSHAVIIHIPIAVVAALVLALTLITAR